MSNQLAPQSDNQNLLTLAGQAANRAAAAGVFGDYQARKSANTLRRQGADLALFAQYLADMGTQPGALIEDPEAWRGVTWGIVAGFVQWQLKAGFAVSSINGRLSTVKTYAGLAALAGAIQPGELALVRTVKSFEHKEERNIDEKRESAGIETRKHGAKKAAPVSITPEQARALKNQPNTPQGRRDRLLMCLMLDLGLRVGEVAALTVDQFNLSAGTLTFYRQKVDKTQTHKLINGTLKAAREWITQDAPPTGSIWRATRRGGELAGEGMSERAITKRVNSLGESAGLAGLSAHDLRHYWATQAARNGTPLDRLQDAGGWASLAMPGRYIEAAAIANTGVKLGDED